MKRILLIIGISILLIGCGGKDEVRHLSGDSQGIDRISISIPEHIRELDSLRVFSPDTQDYDTVNFEQEQVFESNEEVFIKGYIGEVTIDKRDNVFISATAPGEAGIYVFDPDGNHLETVGRFGRGPGEFESIGSIDIRDDQLLVFDPVQQKFSVFSLGDFSLLNEEVIQRGKVQHKDTLAYRLKGNMLHAMDEGNYLLKQQNLAINREEDISTVLYSRVSSQGYLMPGRILELERFRFYFPKNERSKMPVSMPFGRSSLVAISDDGPIYTAWTENYLIKVHDKDGNYQRAIYYPYRNSPLNTSELEVGELRRRAIRQYEIPDSWPALHAMEIDDDNRLWVFSITDSDSTYQGWVLQEDGELLARFSWPGERSRRSVMAPSFQVVIKNDYLYSYERDTKREVDRVVKYRIVFKQQ